MANDTKTNGAAQSPQQKSQADYYHQMAQYYGMTDDQFNQVVGQTPAGQAPKTYGQPTSYFTPERQMSPGGQWKDIDPQQNQNFNTLHLLNQVGLLPQQAPQQQQGSSLQDAWNAYMKQGAQQPQAQQPAVAPITPVTPYGGQQLAGPTPFATIPGTMPTVAPPPAPGAGQQQWQPQQIQRFQEGGPVLPSSVALQGNPGNLLNLLGAAALQEGAYINPTPQPQTPGQFNPGNNFGGGVNTGTFQPTQSSDIPVVPGSQMSWYQVAMGAGLSPNDVTAFQQRGYTPNQVAQKFNLSTGTPGLGGPWSTTPGLFAQAPRMAPTAGIGANWASQLTPTTPAFAAQGTQAPTRWATAPPAPGVNLAGIGAMPRPMGGMGPGPGAMGGAGAMPPPVSPVAHLSGLADAGKVFYSHVTGNDPEKATPEQILDFHSRITNQIAQYTAGANPSAASLPGIPPGGGAAPQVPAASAATTALKAHSGGLVPGRGHGDTVPALLTPGEYVLTKQQTAQLFGGRTPIKMQSGGEVPDDSSDQPPEARRRALSVPVSGGTASSEAQVSSSQGSPPPSAPSGFSSLFSGLAQAAHAYANKVNLNSGGASGGGYNIPANLGGGYIGASPGPGQSGYAYPNQAAATAAGDVGTGVTGGGGLSSPRAQAALGGVASGLGQAAEAIKNSVGSWRMLPNAIPNPPPQEATPQLAQNQAQPTTKREENPLLNPATAAYYQQYMV